MGTRVPLFSRLLRGRLSAFRRHFPTFLAGILHRRPWMRGPADLELQFGSHTTSE